MSVEDRPMRVSSKLLSHSVEDLHEAVVSDPGNNFISIGAAHFEVSPPFGEGSIAIGDAMQPHTGHVAANGQRAFDNFVGKYIVRVVHAEQAFAHITFS